MANLAFSQGQYDRALRFHPDDYPLYFTHHPNWKEPAIETVPVGMAFRIVRRGMAQDWSWDRSAADYLPAVFGTGHYALLPRPELLATALLDWIRQHRESWRAARRHHQQQQHGGASTAPSSTLRSHTSSQAVMANRLFL